MASRLNVDLEAARRAGEVGRPVPDAVDLDVVGVAVAAVPVVHHDDVGLLLAQHGGQPLAGLVDVGLPERAGVVVLRPPGHAGVLVAEPDDAGDAEDRRPTLAVSLAPAVDDASRRRRGRRAPRRGRRRCTRRARRGGPRRRPGPSSPPVLLASSSGWAWTNTMVAIRPPRVTSMVGAIVSVASVPNGCWARSASMSRPCTPSSGRSAGDHRPGLDELVDAVLGDAPVLEHLAGALAGVLAASGRSRATVRLKRGAGAGCFRPSRSMIIWRAMLCGCSAASAIVSTGAKQTSVCSMIEHHSSRVLPLNTSTQPLLQRRPLRLVHLLGELRVVGQPGEAQQLGVELRLDRAERDVRRRRRTRRRRRSGRRCRAG